jgi:type I restriction enzyme R subunit
VLTTGIDAPTVQNIVLVRIVNSMTDSSRSSGAARAYVTTMASCSSASSITPARDANVRRPDFDGDPSIETEQTIDETGEPTSDETVVTPEDEPETDEGPTDLPPDVDDEPRRKFYVDGGHVEVAAHLVYELDPDGNQLRVVQFTDYTADKVRMLYRNAAELRGQWADPDKRREIIDRLEERGIDFDHLAETANQPDADPLDLLCHLAFNAPLRTRRERAQRLRTERQDFFDQYGPEAREILNELLDKYTEHGTAQFVVPDVLELPPINEHGNVIEIAAKFGNAARLRERSTSFRRCCMRQRDDENAMIGQRWQRNSPRR